MDLPNVNPGEIIKSAHINEISSGLEELETLLLNHTSQHGSGSDTTTVTDNDTYLTITVGV